VNFRKRGLFDQARIIEKILSLHYFIRKYIENLNKLIDSYNYLVENKTQESYLKNLDTPIMINKSKGGSGNGIRSQHLQCYVCELRVMILFFAKIMFYRFFDLIIFIRLVDWRWFV